MSGGLFPWEGKQPSPGPLPVSRAIYEARMRRADWREYHRLRILNRANGFCEACGKKTRCLDIHHLTYERLGHERDEDLQAVCRPCHPRADEERKKRDKRPDNSGSGFYSWGLKVFGEDEGDWPDDAEDQFWAWVERKEDRELEAHS